MTSDPEHILLIAVITWYNAIIHKSVLFIDYGWYIFDYKFVPYEMYPMYNKIL